MKNTTAGMWLRTHCGSAEFRLENREFSTALCLRYFQELPYLCTRGQCTFCKPGVNVDRYGHHFVSSCQRDLENDKGDKQKSQRHAIHDQVNYSLYRITTHAMTHAVKEPYHLFNGSDKRPDIYVKFGDNVEINKPYAVDLTIVCPFEGSQSGNLVVPDMPAANANADTHNRFKAKILNKDNKIHNKRADEAKKRKVRDYGELCKNAGMEFVPFVMSSTGKIHAEGISFLKKLATHSAEVRKLSFGTLFRYYKKILSISLIKQVTHTIYNKAIARSSHNNSKDLQDDIRKTNILAIEEGEPNLIYHTNFRET